MVLFYTVKTVTQWFTALSQHLAIIQSIKIMLCFHWFYIVCKSTIQVVLISLFSSLRHNFAIFQFIYPSRNYVVDNRMTYNEIENPLKSRMTTFCKSSFIIPFENPVIRSMTYF